MKNINDVLRIKEQQVQQLQREIEALRVAARLLADETDVMAARPATSTNVAVPAMPPPPMVMRPAPAVAAPVAAPKESATYVTASAWDVSKPQFP